MHTLKVYRDKSKGVSDLLNWAALVDDGRVLCKDGEIVGGFFYSCKDTASSTEAERNYISARVNAALARLDNHWTITHDAVRMPSSEYPAEDLSHFPDPITRLIEKENRDKFIAEGNHFETYYVLILAYQPPLRRDSKVAGFMYDLKSENEESLADKHLAYFNKTLEDLADSLNGVLTLKKMGSYEHVDRFGKTHLRDELINYLHYACTGLPNPINVPPIPMCADEYVCGQELWVGDMPKKKSLNRNHHRKLFLTRSPVVACVSPKTIRPSALFVLATLWTLYLSRLLVLDVIC